MSEAKIIDLNFSKVYAFMLMVFSSSDCNKVCQNESPLLPNSKLRAAGEL